MPEAGRAGLFLGGTAPIGCPARPRPPRRPLRNVPSPSRLRWGWGPRNERPRPLPGRGPAWPHNLPFCLRPKGKLRPLSGEAQQGGCLREWG